MNDFISFPKLNLEFKISDIIVQFDLFGFTFAIKWYGLLIALGFLIAVIYAVRRSKQFDIDPDRMMDVTLVSAIFAFLGARLYYILFSADASYYFEKPIRILQVWNGGLAIYGGIIFAFITAMWMCRVRKVNTLAMFDIASLGFLIGQGIGRWGNFFNQEAFGRNTDLPWGMTGSIIQQEGMKGENYDPLLPVHPTFLYESLWCLLGFVILHYVSKRAYKFKGQIFSMYIVWYGAGRFMIEGLRTDSLMLGATMRVSQIVAALSVLGGIALYFILRARHNSLPVDLFETTSEGEESDIDNGKPLPEDTADNEEEPIEDKPDIDADKTGQYNNTNEETDSPESTIDKSEDNNSK